MATTYTNQQIQAFLALQNSWKIFIINNPTSDPQSFWSNRTAQEHSDYNAWLANGAPNSILSQTTAPASSAVFTNNQKYTHINTSYSGADIVATITPLGGKPMVFAEIQTISYSIYRPIMPVTALGRINPKGIVRGPRTIAGSLIFTVFDRHALKEILNHYSMDPSGLGPAYNFTTDDIQDIRKYAKTDEMPPFDINITFMNEYGNSSTLNLYGIYILTEGQTMSIEDMITENTMQYIAMDIDLMDYGQSMSIPGPGSY